MSGQDVFAVLPPGLLQGLHWLSGVIVFAEALNKLERCAPYAPGLGLRARATVLLKVTAWMLLAIGAGGALITPLLRLDPVPDLVPLRSRDFRLLTLSPI